jgi:apoptosis-inducing factor 3
MVIGEQSAPSGPDLRQGFRSADLAEGSMQVGHVDGEPVLVARYRDQVFAIGAKCTHYGGPLGEGICVDDTVRCPWHHACFSLRTGEALRAPALNPVPCWRVERLGDRLVVSGKANAGEKPGPNTPGSDRSGSGGAPEGVVIVGGGAAGSAAAEMLRRRGYAGPVTIVSGDSSMPYDRPNLSKDYLAGTAPEEWIPLWPRDFYEEHRITLRLGERVQRIDLKDRTAKLSNGASIRFGTLLLATGAEPVRLSIPGAHLPHVHYVRTLVDSRAIIAQAQHAHRAVVIGAGFIGLEVAASLRARGLEIDVVAPEACPLDRVIGMELGGLVRSIHEEHGVRFHLRDTVKSIDSRSVVLASGGALEADLVVAGLGVRPAVELAEGAGISTNHGVIVDERMQTSVRGVFAAGDIARWPDSRTGAPIRVEHWVVAQRQGQVAARAILGDNGRFDMPPFFWSQHYDVSILYVGHAEHWDQLDIAGSVHDRDCAVAFRHGGKTLAVATVGRDRLSLEAELAMERDDEDALATLVPPQSKA